MQPDGPRQQNAESVGWPPEGAVSSTRVFLGLACAQALHSVEEYAFRLYESFPPARFVSGLVSWDIRRGFVLINISIVALAAACYWWPVRHRWASAAPIMWFWVGLETVNGIGHPAWSIREGGYTPGLVSAIVLLCTSVVLAGALRRERGTAAT